MRACTMGSVGLRHVVIYYVLSGWRSEAVHGLYLE